MATTKKRLDDTSDRAFKRALHELLTGSGLKGKEREALRWWAECLHKAGRPIHCRFGVFPGPQDMSELREQLDQKPDLLDAFEASYRESCLEFQRRLGRPYMPNPYPKGWPQINAA